MNKAELIEAIATATEVSKAKAGEMLSATLDTIKAEVAAGNQVALVGFGTFKSTQRAARSGINPKTKEKIKIAARVAPAFKAGSEFRDACNAKKGKKK